MGDGQKSKKDVNESMRSPRTVGEREVGFMLNDPLPLDCNSFLLSQMKKQVGDLTASMILCGKWESTRKQMEVPWKSFRNWCVENNIKIIRKKECLDFLVSLIEENRLSSGTIRSYKNSPALPWRLIKVDATNWEFQELIKAAFIRNPPSSKHMPSWSLDKVLDLLVKEKFSNCSNPFDCLKKAVFLTALASGNRCSELAALNRDSLQFSDSGLVMAVKPGFIYKNQRLGRCPPNIIIPRLISNEALCPVMAIRRLLEIDDDVEGALFKNTSTGARLSSASISQILAKVIHEADPTSIGKGHDVRKIAASLAWTRGVSPEEICKRAFWSSSNCFVTKYLVPGLNNPKCIALGSC